MYRPACNPHHCGTLISEQNKIPKCVHCQKSLLASANEPLCGNEDCTDNDCWCLITQCDPQPAVLCELLHREGDLVCMGHIQKFHLAGTKVKPGPDWTYGDIQGEATIEMLYLMDSLCDVSVVGIDKVFECRIGNGKYDLVYACDIFQE